MVARADRYRKVGIAEVICQGSPNRSDCSRMTSKPETTAAGNVVDGAVEFDGRYVLALTFSHPFAFKIASSAVRNLFRRPATVCLGPPAGMTLPRHKP